MRLVAGRSTLAASLVLLTPLRLSAVVSFSTTAEMAAIGVSNPQAIALADLDGDNIDDLLTVTEFGTVAVFLNDGEGNLEEDDEYDVIDDGPVAVATGFFNGDNFRDAVVANNGSGTISVLIGLGDGTFDTDNDPRRFRVGNNPIGIAVGDFNNDRRDDLLVLSANLVYVLIGNGDGTFSAANPATINTRSTTSFAIAAGFLNSDANLDFAVTNRDNGQVVTFFGNGNGTFTFGQFVAAGQSPTGIVIADADGDRDNDLLVVDSGAQIFDEVRLMRNNGGPDNALLFELPESITSGEEPLAIAALDIEPDSKVDLAVTSVFEGQQISILCQPSDKCDLLPNEQLEAGLFRQARAGTVLGCAEEGQVAIAAGRLNGDNMDDLVALGGDLGTLCVAINTSRVGMPTPGTPTAPAPSPTGPTPTPTQTRTFTPTATATEVPVIGLGVCNTSDLSPPLGIGLGRPVAVAAEDFDRDGDRDVAVADATGGRIVILNTTLNPVVNPSQPCQALRLRAGATLPVSGPRKLAAADLDRDGSADLVVIGDQGLSLFYGDGAGGFSASVANPIPAGVAPSALAITDFNRDFTADVIVSDLGSQDVSIFVGTRQRAQPFAGRCAMPAGRTTSLVVATDLNADGRADFAVSGATTRDVAVFLQRGEATLACDNMAASFQGQSPLSLPSDAAGLIAGLFTLADSVPDLAVALRVIGGNGTVMLFEGRPAGASGVTYQPGTPVAIPTPRGGESGALPTDIGSGDVERDGRIDLLVIDAQNDTLAEFRGQASGGIGIGLDTLPVGVGPVDLEVVDIDRDGRDDVIVANAGNGTVSYLLSNQRAFTPTPVPTSTPSLTPTPEPTQTVTPTVTFTPSRTSRPSPTHTPAPTNTQRGVVTLGEGGCSIPQQGTGHPGGGLLVALGLFALLRRPRIPGS